MGDNWEQVSSDRDAVELRGPCPRGVVDVLDAISLARGLTRTQVVNEVLGDWARRVLHEHKVVARTLRSHPAAGESFGRGRE